MRQLGRLATTGVTKEVNQTVGEAGSTPRVFVHSFAHDVEDVAACAGVPDVLLVFVVGRGGAGGIYIGVVRGSEPVKVVVLQGVALALASAGLPDELGDVAVFLLNVNELKAIRGWQVQDRLMGR